MRAAATQAGGAEPPVAPDLAPCGDVARVAHLRQWPGQFASDGAQIAADPTPGVTLHEIRWGAAVVGCFKLDPLYHQRHAFASPASVGVRGVLVDRQLQGRGIGTAALCALGAYVTAAFPGAAEAVLTVNVGNPSARRAYLRAGFLDHGEVYLGGSRGPQHVLRLPLGGPVPGRADLGEPANGA